MQAQKAHTPKPASLMHNIPFQERMSHENFRIVQPASRVVFERVLEKLANYTKFKRRHGVPPTSGDYSID
jgi:hypothetical protein